MASEIRKCYFECLRVEKGKEKNYQFVFNTDFGEYNLEEGEEYYDLFRPGNKYIGVVKQVVFLILLVRKIKLKIFVLCLII
jgi:hypothetical protein